MDILKTSLPNIFFYLTPSNIFRWRHLTNTSNYCIQIMFLVIIFIFMFYFIDFFFALYVDFWYNTKFYFITWLTLDKLLQVIRVRHLIPRGQLTLKWVRGDQVRMGTHDMVMVTVYHGCLWGSKHLINKLYNIFMKQ